MSLNLTQEEKDAILRKEKSRFSGIEVPDAKKIMREGIRDMLNKFPDTKRNFQTYFDFETNSEKVPSEHGTH